MAGACALLLAAPLGAAAQAVPSTLRDALPAAVRATLRPKAQALLSAPDSLPRTRRLGSDRLDARTGAVRAAFRLDGAPESAAASRTPEAAARAFLRRRARALGIAGVPLRTARVLAGAFDAHVTLAQTVGGLDLDGATAHVALDRRGAVVQVAQSLNADAARWAETHVLAPTTLSADDAEAVARAAVAAGPATVVPVARVALWRDDARDVRPSWRLAVYPHGTAAAWTVWVDAVTGALLGCGTTRSAARRADGSAPEREDGASERAEGASSFTAADASSPFAPRPFLDGRGLVFDPDPLTTSGAAYGTGGFVDGNDADTPDLLAQRREATLPALAQEASLYVLKGPYVEITGDPAVGGTSFVPPAESDPAAFRYPRSDKRFEAVMAYHHLDAMQRYVQALSLGRPVLERPVRVNPHGLGAQDNSLFYAATFSIAFGDGGIDDAEDADVLRHEYTHALLHDQQPALFATTEGRALHEGYADYLAASFSRAAGDPAWRRVYTWDGHNGCWQGRTLDHGGRYNATDRLGMAYPAAPGCAAFPTLYQWGLLWATTLADVSDELGRAVADRLVVGSMAYLAPVASGVPAFEAAAEALLAADRAFYADAHRTALENRLVARGLLPARLGPTLAHTPPPPAPGTASVRLAVTARAGLDPVSAVTARVVADRFADTLLLPPVTLVREGTTDTYAATVAVPEGTVALRYTFAATDIAGRAVQSGPFEAVVQRVAEQNAALSATPSGVWQAFDGAWAAAPRSLAEGSAYVPPVSSLSLVPLDLPRNAPRLRLVLRHRVDLRAGAGARVALSDDGGHSWQPLVPVGGYARTFAAPGHPMDGAGVFALTDTARATFDLARWAGGQVRIRLDLGLTRPMQGGEAWTVPGVVLTAATPDAALETVRANAVSTPFPNPFRARTSFAVTVAEASCGFGRGGGRAGPPRGPVDGPRVCGAGNGAAVVRRRGGGRVHRPRAHRIGHVHENRRLGGQLTQGMGARGGHTPFLTPRRRGRCAGS